MKRLLIPEPEGVGISDKGDIYGEEQFKEIIEGEVPDHLKKKAPRRKSRHEIRWILKADWMRRCAFRSNDF